MKILVVTNQYPSENEKYMNGFVHSRVRNYMDNNIEVEVLTYNNRISESKQYIYEEVSVSILNEISLIERIQNNDYNLILIHFAFRRYTELILNHKPNDMNVVVWVHGYEALHWSRRTFNFKLNNVKQYFRYILSNTLQLRFFRKLIKYQNNTNVHFVFVSNWMKDITENDTAIEIENGKYSIIANPVDTKIFKHTVKQTQDRLNIFNLRPYSGNTKYANDITVEVIKKLSEKTYFSDLTFNLYGDGDEMSNILEPISQFNNVRIHKGFLNHEEIKKVHNANGIVLMPTRQDAQGVSMCEAICSGLVPVVSNNTAIPEFVNDSYGYLCDEIDDYVNAIEEMYYNPAEFIIKSKNTKELSDRLSEKTVINGELNLIHNKSKKIQER